MWNKQDKRLASKRKRERKPQYPDIEQYGLAYLLNFKA